MTSSFAPSNTSTVVQANPTSDLSVGSVSQTLFGKSWNDLILFVKPTDETEKKIKDVFHEVKDVLKSAEFSKQILKIVKGGSVGKRTNLKDNNNVGKSDLDIVVFLKDFDLKTREIYRTQFLSSLSKKFPNNAPATEKQHAITFRVKDLKVDLLLTRELSGGAQEMCNLSPAEREAYSASLVILQHGFFKLQAENYRDLVCVAKFWRNDNNKKWSEPLKTRPSSYLIELLMLYAYQNTTFSSNSDMFFDQVFERFLNIVVNWNSIYMCWSAHYSEDFARKQTHKLPIVLDPSNPMNNVADRMTDWTEFKKYAAKSLENVKESQTNQTVLSLKKELNQFRLQVESLKTTIVDLNTSIQQLKKEQEKLAWKDKIVLSEFQHSKGYQGYYEKQFKFQDKSFGLYANYQGDIFCKVISSIDCTLEIELILIRTKTADGKPVSSSDPQKLTFQYVFSNEKRTYGWEKIEAGYFSGTFEILKMTY